MQGANVETVVWKGEDSDPSPSDGRSTQWPEVFRTGIEASRRKWLSCQVFKQRQNNPIYVMFSKDHNANGYHLLSAFYTLSILYVLIFLNFRNNPMSLRQFVQITAMMLAKHTHGIWYLIISEGIRSLFVLLTSLTRTPFLTPNLVVNLGVTVQRTDTEA